MNPTGRRRLSFGLTAAVTLFLSIDAVVHLANVSVVRESMAELGYPEHLSPVIGAIELVVIALFVWRRTQLLGAVLLTGYFGGAIATNLRVEKPLLSTVLFPIYLAIAAWGGLYLRDEQLRELVRGMIKRTSPQGTVLATTKGVQA
jgi:DoxX-like family